MEVEYVAAFEASMVVTWFHKFFRDLQVIYVMDKPITLCCDNTVTIANTKEFIQHKIYKEDVTYYKRN